MFRRKKIFILSLFLIGFFVISTNLLFNKLTKTTNYKQRSIDDEIYDLINFKNQYQLNYAAFDDLVKTVNDLESGDFGNIWSIANSWVSKTGLVDLKSQRIGNVLFALKTFKVIKADLDTRGTQLKLLLTLEGGQKAVFKPQWYEVSRIIEGPVYAGKDRFSSEIIAFYISLLLNFPFTPCSARRHVSLTREILPVATKRLINTTFKRSNNQTCLYGECFYCKKEDPICEDSTLSLTGAMILNVNAQFKSYRSPWQRTYKKKKASWEESNDYCKKVVKEQLPKRRILDLVDVAIFDFLLQNGDRHHYETLHDNVVLIDNGKGFGNPNITHLDILAPLYQCCIYILFRWLSDPSSQYFPFFARVWTILFVSLIFLCYTYVYIRLLQVKEQYLPPNNEIDWWNFATNSPKNARY